MVRSPAGDLWVWLYVQPVSMCQAKTVGSLIKAGAFDYMGHARRALFEVHERVIESVLWLKRSEQDGDLFDDSDPVREACISRGPQ